ncbi:MAG: cell division protein FtsA [Candidatus Paceibacterota bacterium]
MSRITAGIDIGTYQIKVVVAERSKKGGGNRAPTILGTGFAQSRGLRHGYIINTRDIARSIASAIEEAERAAGVKIKKVHLAVGGVGLDEIRSYGETLISRADNEATDLDLGKAVDASEEQIRRHLTNRKIIHVIPLKYKIDGETILGRPIGMKGSKLSVETLFVTSLEQHLQDLISVIEDIGISVIDVMASPIAASFVTLTKAQKTAGCVLANVGSETVSLAVFEDNIPISLKVFPIGGTDITNDIALGLQVSLEEAEQIKRGAITNSTYSQKELDRIIVARLSDIFELIESHLKKIGKNGLLPAGIILAGGGSGVTTIEDLAKAALKIPSRRISLSINSGAGIKDSSWAVAYGLCVWGLSEDPEPIGLTFARETSGTIAMWLKQFLP